MCLYVFLVICFFFFKQKTAYEMRISDWSSDVCSSDLGPRRQRGEEGGDGAAGGREVQSGGDHGCFSAGGARARPRTGAQAARRHRGKAGRNAPAIALGRPRFRQIGRASGRERGGSYV